jgi:hypothetical protein
LGAIVVVAVAVVTLRATDDSKNDATGRDDPQPVEVERFAADNVVLPAPGKPPGPPPRVVATPDDRTLRVAWADALPGGTPPAAAAGYEVRWETDDDGPHTRLVAAPEAALTGLSNGSRYRVEVRTVDPFGQRSAPAKVSGTPNRARTPWRDALTGLYDDFPDPTTVSERWHLSGYRGCVDVVAGRTKGLPIELGCGADLAVLRARQPMTLTAPTAGGELGRVTVRTDTAGAGGELTVNLVPGPADRVGTEGQRANRFAERETTLPAGTVRVGVDDSGVHVSAAPDVPAAAPPALEVFQAPRRGPGVSHLFEVVLTTSGLRVYQDGLLVSVAGVVPAWHSASVLLGFRGPDGRRSRVHLTSAGFSGPATALVPITEVPVNAGTQRVLDLVEEPPQLGIARTPLATAATARLVATIMTANALDPRGVVMQFGDVRVPARPVVPDPTVASGAAVTVVADVPMALLGSAGADSITPFVLRAPGASQEVRLVETYLEITPVPGARTSPPSSPPPARPGEADMPPAIDAVLCNSAGEPLNSSVVPARGQIVLRVDLNAASSQWETGSIRGVQGFQVWVDGTLAAGVPTRADGPGLGGKHAMSISTSGFDTGAHVLEVREYAMAGDERPVSVVLNFTVR